MTGKNVPPRGSLSCGGEQNALKKHARKRANAEMVLLSAPGQKSRIFSTAGQDRRFDLQE